jgi:hypothetical protein
MSYTVKVEGIVVRMASLNLVFFFLTSCQVVVVNAVPSATDSSELPP